MPIERTEKIQFHIKGTLDAVTRWIDSHQTGIPEWLKNARRQYQDDRANVQDEFRAVAILFQDAKGANPARIGLLDVGGATREDITSWEVWQDPEASRRRGSDLEEEQTQGNGGKAYMFRMFLGPARILGVRDGRRNCMGFEGAVGTEERGTPGWMPDAASGRDLEISSFDAELRSALEPYGITVRELPPVMQKALKSRQAFTLVEGLDPAGLYKGQIEADELLAKVIRHEQAVLCLEQLEVYAFYNGRLLNDGKKLSLPAIKPYPELESPSVYELPDQLPLENGQLISTTEGGTKARGRLTLHTSADNMYTAWKTLRPRWQVVYRTRYQMIGAKSVGELVQTPGVQFIYGVLELPALEPAYVEHGRGRPKNGPLTEAVDIFIAEKIRELAHEINMRRKQDLDDRALDDVHHENQELDDFKNQFLPDWGEGEGGGSGTGGGGGRGGGGGGYKTGTVPEFIDYAMPTNGIDMARGISLALKPLLAMVVRDAKRHPVVDAKVKWSSSDEHVAIVDDDGNLIAKEKGDCEVWAQVKGTTIQTARIPVHVWNVDHVLLTPRTLEIPLGKRAQIVAEVTDDDGRRSTLVYLDWKHDADNPLIVRVGKGGTVTANRIGRTSISAGADSVWARTPVEVKVIPNPSTDEKGSGFPRLLLTDRDIDPATGSVREGDPDSPALWQDVTDVANNIWWLNLQSPEAAFAFRQRGTNPALWRTFHAERVIDMVVQVWMADDYTRKGLNEPPELWGTHSQTVDVHRVLIVQEMWKRLEAYVNDGSIASEE